jgi:hypothetical protein
MGNISLRGSQSHPRDRGLDPRSSRTRAGARSSRTRFEGGVAALVVSGDELAARGWRSSAEATRQQGLHHGARIYSDRVLHRGDPSESRPNTKARQPAYAGGRGSAKGKNIPLSPRIDHLLNRDVRGALARLSCSN